MQVIVGLEAGGKVYYEFQVKQVKVKIMLH
jgi:hypothetical protein